MNRASEKSTRNERPQRGSVLLIVMITVAMLSLLVVTLINARTAANFSALAASELARQEYAATGGMEIARALLKQDKGNSENDNLFEAWARPRRCEIGGYDCEILIVDEESKINMTKLSSEDADTIERMTRLLIMIVQDIKVEVAEKKVAEACKTMAEDLEKYSISVVTFEQLLNYPPFTEEIVYGAKDESGRIVEAGLTEYITFQNTVKTNINTAPREVLLATLGFENEELVDRIIEFREREDDDGNRYGFTDFNRLKKSAEGENPEGYGENNVLFHQDSITLISQHFDVNSSIFLITALSPTQALIGSGDGSEGLALPARGWVWMMERTNKGEINTISLREATQPAAYSEGER